MIDPARPSQPVIVTRAEVERVFVQKNGESAIHEAAKEASPLEHAQAMAMTGAILRELQKAEDAEGTDRVMITAQHGPASRMQSLLASGEGGSLKVIPMPAGGLEAKFDTSDWLGWASVAWAKLKHPTPHALLKPSKPGPQPLADKGRVGLVGDWGTGLYGAPHIGTAIRDVGNRRDPFIMLMHLGDVYYAGTKGEMKERFLDVWPMRANTIHRALNSNHDMYSGGEYYFEDTLQAFNQDASYFAHQNAHWTLVGLDTNWTTEGGSLRDEDHAIDDGQVEWLKSILDQAGDRKVILFSHHQLFSCFDSQGEKLWANQGFAEVLKSGRIFAWYWGHEHRCCIYQEPDAASRLWGRCIGHGSMPESRKKTRNLPKATSQNKADWRLAPARVKNNVRLAPPSLVLEGPNRYIKGEEDDFLPHGYAVLTLDGAHLIEQVLDADGAVIYEHQLA